MRMRYIEEARQLDSGLSAKPNQANGSAMAQRTAIGKNDAPPYLAYRDPDNKVSAYTVLLPHPIDLGPNWLVTLCEISYTKSWFNVQESKIGMVYVDGIGDDVGPSVRGERRYCGDREPGGPIQCARCRCFRELGRTGI